MPSSSRRRAGGARNGVALAIAGTGALLTSWVTLHGRPFGWEQTLDDGLAPLRAHPIVDGLQLLTQLGAGPVLFPLLALACWGTTPRGRRADLIAWLPLAVLALGQAVESVLLAPFLRVGPEVAQLPLLSLGSGHTASAVLGWGLLARQLRGTRLAVTAARSQLFVPVTVGLTRVALGERWVSDVGIGLAVGAVLLTIGVRLLDAGPLATDGSSKSTHRPAHLAWWRRSPWAWAITAAAAGIAVVPALLAPRQRWFGDLLVYAGSGGSAGLGQDVYAYRTMFGLPFTYPPFAAVLAEPLSRVPWPLLQALWCAATLLAAAAVAKIVLAPVVQRIGLPLTTAALLVSSPMRSHIRFGQVGVFLVLLVAVDLLGRNERRRPGLGLGLASAIKLTPAVFLPWLALSGQRRRLRSTVLCALAATTAGLLLLWPSASDYLVSALWDSSRFGANDIPGNQSVRGMLLRTGLDGRPAAALWLASALVLPVLAMRGAVRLERAGNRLGAVAVLACLSLAVSPISWVHHLVWLTFPIAALAAARRIALAAAWWAVLLPGLPALHAGALITDAQGLTAVAAIVLLPRLLDQGVRPTSGPPTPTAHPATVRR